MKDELSKRIEKASTLDEVQHELIKFLRSVSVTGEQGVSRIGYVSGILTSEGEERIIKNTEILRGHTEKLRLAHDFPIFSLTDVFDSEVFARINSHSISYENWLYFWRAVLQNGNITDVFMTPRWELSTGAKDEHETAKSLGLNIIYVN